MGHGPVIDELQGRDERTQLRRGRKYAVVREERMARSWNQRGETFDKDNGPMGSSLLLARIVSASALSKKASNYPGQPTCDEYNL